MSLTVKQVDFISTDEIGGLWIGQNDVSVSCIITKKIKSNIEKATKQNLALSLLLTHLF